MLQPKAEKNCAAVSDIFPQLGFNALNRPVDDEDIQFIYNGLQQVDGCCGLKWILTPETSTYDTCFELLNLTVDSIIGRYTEDGGDISAVISQMSVSFEQMKQVEEKTRNQRNSALWHQLRQKRLTASNFGSILTAAKSQTLSQSLFKKLQGHF